MNLLRETREKAGLTMTDLALEAGIEPSLLCLYEKGKRPNRRNAERVAAALGVNPREVFSDFDELRKY